MESTPLDFVFVTPSSISSLGLLVQLVVGSAKETSVNGINTAVRLRNDELQARFDCSVQSYRVDGLSNLFGIIRNKPSCDYIFIDSFYCWEAILYACILKHRSGAKIILWTHGAFNINRKEFHKIFYFHVNLHIGCICEISAAGFLWKHQFGCPVILM